MALPEHVMINGTRYATAELSEVARAQVVNLQAVEAELMRLQQQQAIAQTARNAYLALLTGALPKPAAADAEGAEAGKAKKATKPRARKKADESAA